MSETKARGNRSKGKVGDYLKMVSQGKTCAEIGESFGVSGSAVRKMLDKHHLPNCGAAYLRWLSQQPPQLPNTLAESKSEST